jgi:hypothetical protein
MTEQGHDQRLGAQTAACGRRRVETLTKGRSGDGAGPEGTIAAMISGSVRKRPWGRPPYAT